MVDGITQALASLNVEPFTQLATFLDSYCWWLFLLPSVAFYLLYPNVRHNKLRTFSFAGALILTAVLIIFIKWAFALPRPCADMVWLAKTGLCPPDYSFPSGHTAYSFVFTGASLGTSFFPLFFLLSILVALSRVYLGVHTFTDVIGGVVVGLGCYFIVENLLRELFPSIVPESERKKIEKMKQEGAHLEIRRDIAHIAFGTAIITSVHFFGAGWTGLLLLLSLFLGMAAMHLRMKQKPIPFIDQLFDLLERPRVMPAKGAFMYVLGALLALSFLQDASKSSAVIAVLAWGDGMATIVGQLWGKYSPLPYNKKKSAHGALAFFLFGGTVAYLFIGLSSFLLAAICAMIETLDLKIDDNLLIPLVGILYLLF